MALFSSSPAFLGLDLGTSTLKVVEIIDRKKRLEVTAYAQANLPNLLLQPGGSVEDALRSTANVVSQMLDKAATTSEYVIAALPSSVVFSTVLMLPDLPEADLTKAVHFAAREVVPTSLDEMVLGWSRLGERPHMETTAAVADLSTPQSLVAKTTTIPIFVTAAPKAIIDRYLKLIDLLKLKMHALEVETFPLARSLLQQSTDSTLIIDVGDLATTYHVIEQGAARISHTIEYGGQNITLLLAKAAAVTIEEAEQQKGQYGVVESAPSLVRETILKGLETIIDQARRIQESYTKQTTRQVSRIILIGGGANLPGLSETCSRLLSRKTSIGNPWKGLAYPEELELFLTESGPRYAVAVGLALRGFSVA